MIYKHINNTVFWVPRIALAASGRVLYSMSGCLVEIVFLGVWGEREPRLGVMAKNIFTKNHKDKYI